jgi:hypothetical protein
LREEPLDGEAGKATFGGTGFFDLGLIPLAFCDDRAQRDRRKPCKFCDLRNAYTAATKLHNCAPALTKPFRIVWIVTILQQAFACFYGD